MDWHKAPPLEWHLDLGKSCPSAWVVGGVSTRLNRTGNIRKQEETQAYLVISFIIVLKPPFFIRAKLQGLFVITECQPDGLVWICSGRSLHEDTLAMGSRPSRRVCAQTGAREPGQDGSPYQHHRRAGGCPARGHSLLSPGTAPGHVGKGCRGSLRSPSPQEGATSGAGWSWGGLQLHTIFAVYLVSAGLLCGQIVLVSRYLEWII